MMLLDTAIALAAAALAGTGVGGGGLLVIYLSLAKNIGQLCAQGINLVFFVSGAASSVPMHVKRRSMDAFTVIALGVSGAAGAYAGLMMAKLIDPRYLRTIFGAFLILCGMKTLKSK